MKFELGEQGFRERYSSHDTDGSASSISPEELLCVCCAEGNHEDVVPLLPKIDVNVADERGKTPLLIASRYGHVEVVQTLLEAGAKIDATDNLGRTALMRAADFGHVDVVKTLLRWGATVDTRITATTIVDSEQREGVNWTALMLAVVHRGAAIPKLLLEAGANPEVTDTLGRTPLMRAAERGRTAVVKLLLLTGGVSVGTRDKDGSTAFSLADKHSNCVAVLRLLLPIMAVGGIVPPVSPPSTFIEGELLGGLGRVWRRHTRATSGRSLTAWLRVIAAPPSTPHLDDDT